LSVTKVLEEALHRLVERGDIRDRDRSLLFLRAGGLSYKEIEELLGVPEKTASRKFSRLKPLVRRELDQMGVAFPDIDGITNP